MTSDAAIKAPWHLPADEVCEALGSGPGGLSAEEVQRRGGEPNQIAAAARGSWQLIWRQIANPLVVVLAVAAGLSASIGEGADAAVILAILVLNAVAGFVQEWKADQAVAALQAMVSRRTMVVRDGKLLELDPVELVVGDRVVLEAGDVVPADVRWVDVRNVEVEEGALSGESVPIAKSVSTVPAEAALAERTSMGFLGTHLTRGRGVGVVTAVGMATEVGRIAGMTAEVGREPSPLERQLDRVARQIGLFAIVVTIAVALAGWAAGGDAAEMFLTGVALAVAVVPEGLVAAVTVTLALGVRSMAARHVLLRRLQAVEALGAATVICTDKTGTLTRNEMTVQRVVLAGGEVEVASDGYAPEGSFLVEGRSLADPVLEADLRVALRAALECSHAEVARGESGWEVQGDPMEGAMVAAAGIAGLERRPMLEEIPFDADTRWMAARVDEDAWVKGAPEVVTARCVAVLDRGVERPLTDEDRAWLSERRAALGGEGLRLLAVARQPRFGTFEDLVLLGLFALIDPPRPESAGAVALARRAGIDVKMVTGDAAETARTIAKAVGIDGEVIARAAPEDKLVLIGKLQAAGEVVAMTGDGVNDAPALKAADVGVAMGNRGTDVARGAADIVLTDDNFASIVAGIEEGRRQLDNIGKFLRYLLSSNLAEVLAIGLSVLSGGPLLLLPVQILWMNLVTDGPTAIALGAEPAEPDVMDRPPRRPNAPLLPRRALVGMGAAGAYMAAVALVLFQLRVAEGDVDRARTVAFTALIVMQKVNVLNFRALRYPLSSVGPFSNGWLLLAVAGTLGLHALALYLPPLQALLHTVPLGLADLGIIALTALPVVLGPELVKTVWRPK